MIVPFSKDNKLKLYVTVPIGSTSPTKDFDTYARVTFGKHHSYSKDLDPLKANHIVFVQHLIDGMWCTVETFHGVGNTIGFPLHVDKGCSCRICFNCNEQNSTSIHLCDDTPVPPVPETSNGNAYSGFVKMLNVPVTDPKQIPVPTPDMIFGGGTSSNNMTPNPDYDPTDPSTYITERTTPSEFIPWDWIQDHPYDGYYFYVILNENCPDANSLKITCSGLPVASEIIGTFSAVDPNELLTDPDAPVRDFTIIAIPSNFQADTYIGDIVVEYK